MTTQKRTPDYYRKHRESEQKRYHKRREILQNIKMKTGCVDCGYNEHPAALHFDHMPSEKKQFGIAQNHSRKWETLIQEIQKCEVVCANCHAVRTDQRRTRENPVSANKAENVLWPTLWQAP